MTLQLMKSLGLDTLGTSQLILLFSCQMLVAFIVGAYAHEVAPRLGFGVIGNSMVLFLSLWSGLVAYAHFVQPLRYAPPPVYLGVAVGSAVLGLITLTLVLRRPYHF
mgnify:CR=1 FL=1